MSFLSPGPFSNAHEMKACLSRLRKPRQTTNTATPDSLFFQHFCHYTFTLLAAMASCQSACSSSKSRSGLGLHKTSKHTSDGFLSFLLQTSESHEHVVYTCFQKTLCKSYASCSTVSFVDHINASTLEFLIPLLLEALNMHISRNSSDQKLVFRFWEAVKASSNTRMTRLYVLCSKKPPSQDMVCFWPFPST